MKYVTRKPEFVSDQVLRLFHFFSCSTQLSIKIELLIDAEITKINCSFVFRSPKPVVYLAHKCLNANNR